ncbi:ribonuclease P protein component [Luteimonas sp. BDR2-5]|uniref:ribonuclease P protein component n=1 Tax=Proluteimonas luteida TaxID=2878685 RepID=UPI001E6563BD|nr:ribonuclease P protein component [Luteimonas sp. BDR2-5]MCD9027924.1 ribonuclease P protein component [Luteimonas sp. BDR2-5]
MNSGARFPREARVRLRAEFDRVFADARRTATPLLAVHLLREPGQARLGLAVSRKVDKRAVGRNRIKRVLREQFRRLRPQLVPGCYVVVARPAAAGADARAIGTAFTAALQRAGALPPVAATGTMPAASTPPSPPASAGA